MLVGAVTLPFALFFYSSGEPAFMAIALNMVLVMAALLFVINNQYETFAKLVETQDQLFERNLETQKLSDANHALANLDPLTNLPNRRQFFQRLEEQIEQSRTRGRHFGLAVIDLDGFKPVNDIYGHAVGDAVLVEAGRRLSETCGSDAFCARLGGDEFAVILRLPEGAEACENQFRALGGAICQTLSAPFHIDDIVANLSASVGVAIWPESTADGECLYECADYALYHGKQNERGGVIVFSEDHRSAMRQLARIQHEMRKCDFNAEMSIALQPIHDISRGALRSFEALARWKSPVFGAVSPAVFIPIAEKCGLIAQLTPSLLAKTLEAVRALPADVSVSFNLSARDVCSAQTVLTIVALLRNSGVDPKRLVFEITETAVMNDFEQARDALKALRAMGARIALDDFGSGYSSLTHVHRLPLDIIKIDRAFVADIDSNVACQTIVRSIVGLSATLGAECIVEGVEKSEHVRALRKLGVTKMQGYYFGAALEPLAAVAYAQECAAQTHASITGIAEDTEPSAPPRAAVRLV